MIWRSGLDRRCSWFNRPWLDFTGRAMEQEIGAGWSEIVHPDDVAACLESYDAAFDRRVPFSSIYRLRRHDGVYRWMRGKGAPLIQDGQFAGFVGSAVDVTEQRVAEERLETLLAERAVLLRELHHRVRNNMQMIVSFLNLQANRTQNPQARAALRDAVHRVQAFDAVHQRLRDLERLEQPDLAPYFCDLAADLVAARAGERIELVCEMAPTPSSMSQASALGLILAELLTNAVEHAFEERRRGRIVIRLQSVADGEAVLTIRDDGRGFLVPPDLSEPPSTVGLSLVRALAQQAGARIGFANAEGAAITLTFRPDRAPSDRLLYA